MKLAERIATTGSTIDFFYCEEYRKHGCYFRGALIVVPIMDISTEVDKTLPLEGFGQGTSFSVSDIAKGIISDRHSVIATLLTIPDLVVRIDLSEWEREVAALSNKSDSNH